MKVALADRHQILREGLESLFGFTTDVEIVGSYGDGRSLVDALPLIDPDVVVIEAHLPDGTGAEWAQRIRLFAPEVKILVLTASHSDADLVLSLEAGVDGYLYKEGSTEDLLRALHEVCMEHFYVSPSAARQMRDLTVTPSDGALTPREFQVLVASRDGLTTEEIGAKLLLSPSTIKTHLGSIYRKLDVRNRVEAVHEAVRRGIIGQQ